MRKREAFVMALLNSAALVECSDLEQLYGEVPSDKDANILTDARLKVVNLLRNKAYGYKRVGGGE